MRFFLSLITIEKRGKRGRSEVKCKRWKDGGCLRIWGIYLGTSESGDWGKWDFGFGSGRF